MNTTRETNKSNQKFMHSCRALIPLELTEIHWIAHMTGMLQLMDTSTQERKPGKARRKRVALCAKGWVKCIQFCSETKGDIQDVMRKIKG